jgi:hypothetical protein
MLAVLREALPKRRTLMLLAAPLAAAALLVGGCGDDDDDAAEDTTSEAQSSETMWASEVCGAVAAWQTSITTIDFSEGLSKDALATNVEDAEQATTDLVDQLKTIGAPETDEGQQAKQEIDQLGEDLTTTVDSVKQEAQELADADGAGLAAGLTKIALSVSQLIDDGKQTLADIEEIEPDGQLSDAVKNDEQCQGLSSEDEE